MAISYYYYQPWGQTSSPTKKSFTRIINHNHTPVSCITDITATLMIVTDHCWLGQVTIKIIINPKLVISTLLTNHYQLVNNNTHHQLIAQLIIRSDQVVSLMPGCYMDVRFQIAAGAVGHPASSILEPERHRCPSDDDKAT